MDRDIGKSEDCESALWDTYWWPKICRECGIYQAKQQMRENLRREVLTWLMLGVLLVSMIAVVYFAFSFGYLTLDVPESGGHSGVPYTLRSD